MHYENNFRSIFIDKKGYYTAGESRLLHRLLFAAPLSSHDQPRPGAPDLQPEEEIT